MARLTALRLLALLACAAVLTTGATAPPAPADYINLADVSRRYGLTGTSAEAGREYALRSLWTSLTFTAGSREASWNGYRLFLGEPVKEGKRALYLSPTDWRAVIRPLLDAGAVPAPGRLERVVIDPGHGGSDPGTENRGLKLAEKNMTLDVARRLKKDLEARGYRVFLTRTTDAKLRPGQLDDLRLRAKKAVQWGADLFISLHFNSLPGYPKTSGVETYALTPAGQRSTASSTHARGDQVAFPGNAHDHWNMVLSAAMHQALQERLPVEDRGLKHARFAVLRTVECPAVLIEAGFLSNPAEARRIGTAAYRQEIAHAIGEGVRAYDLRLRAATRGVE